jgi:hypothetical protein
MGLNLVALLVGPIPFHVAGIGLTVFDVLGIAGALSMAGLLARRVIRNLRDLARAEPPHR